MTETGPAPTAGSTGPPPNDRRPWIIAGVLGVIIVILIVLLLIQGDDDDDAAGSSTSTSTTTTEPTTTTGSPTTTESPTTTGVEATTTTANPVVTVPPAECDEAGANAAQPGSAAVTVFDAWVRGDSDCAATLMTPSALAELFSRDGTGATDEFQGCTEQDVPDPVADCAFTFEGGSTHYLMNFSPTDGWTVIDVNQVAD